MFVCPACDGSGGIKKGCHFPEHKLVRCLRRVSAVGTAGHGNGNGEARIECLEMGMLALERRFDSFERRLDERLTRMEGLLQRMITQPQPGSLRKQ